LDGDYELLRIDPLPNFGNKTLPNERRCPKRKCHIDPDGRPFSIVFERKATRKDVTQNKNVKVLTIENSQ
jgi:hypothetical protein